MRQDIFERFDKVLSGLKAIEPSASFDFEFRQKLNEAIAKRYEETFFDKIIRRAGEATGEIRRVLLPEAPVLVRAIATFVIVISIGIYLYSIQPASPVATPPEGIVMVQGIREAEPRKMTLARKLKTGDVIIAKEGAQVDIGLSNKYVMRIKEKTALRIVKLTPHYGKGKAAFELIEGRILASVDEGFGGSQFVVDTKAATATALGTKFLVDVSREGKFKTEVNVAEGKVEVKSHYAPQKLVLAKQVVTVGAGQKTEVPIGELPTAPEHLMEDEWLKLEEIYQIGKKPQVILLVKNTPDRAKQLLRPCPIYISDEKPRQIPELLEDAVLKIDEAIKTGDIKIHLEAVKTLERIVEKYPNPKYDVQFLLYIGAYYEYLGYHKEAIQTFENATSKYPHSPFVSIAQCAAAIIYEDKLNDKKKADEIYRMILGKYPNSLEAIWAEGKVRNQKI